MIYYCDQCKEFVSDNDAIRKDHSEYHSEVDTRQYEYWSTYHCPSCGNELDEVADKCRCGNPMRNGEILCEECSSIIDEEWQKMIYKLTPRFGESVESYIYDYLEKKE